MIDGSRFSMTLAFGAVFIALCTFPSEGRSCFWQMLSSHSFNSYSTKKFSVAIAPATSGGRRSLPQIVVTARWEVCITRVWPGPNKATPMPPPAEPFSESWAEIIGSNSKNVSGSFQIYFDGRVSVRSFESKAVIFRHTLRSHFLHPCQMKGPSVKITSLISIAPGNTYLDYWYRL